MRRLVSRQQLLAAGITETEVRTRVRRGELIRLAAGVYAEAAVYASASRDHRYALTVVAEAMRSPDLVVSHASAAAVHDLPLLGVSRDRVHLTRPGRGGHRESVTRIVHAGYVPPHRLVMVNDVSVTDPARTLVDLARSEPASCAVVAADAALQRGLVDASDLARAAREAQWHKGIPAALRALRLADGRAESPGESLLRLVLAEDPRLPALQLQVEVLDETGRLIGRVDAGMLDHGVLIEFDGKIKYGALLRPGESPTDAVVREKRREERLTELGWLVLRVSWGDLRAGAALRSRVRAACDARRPLVERGALRGSAVVRPSVRVEC